MSYSNVSIKTWPDRTALMRGIADTVASELRQALANNGQASLAVPGGTTPGPFLEMLSEEDMDWSNVTVLLTDERVVPEDSNRSNTRLVRETLLRNHAAEATLINYNAGADPLNEARERVQAILPIDVLVLGMGADMHTASLFPDAKELANAVADDAPVLVEVNPAGQPESRLSLSGPVLKSAKNAHILIQGPEKMTALETALEYGPVAEAPVRTVFEAERPVTVHYAT